MIQVIHRAFDILEMIAKTPDRALSLSEIADELGLNQGTCANIIKTMINRQYIEKLDLKKGYRLGVMAYRLSNNKAYQLDLITAAQEEMDKLTANLNENSLLAVLRENRRVAILRRNSSHNLQVITAEDKNAYESASGRMLVASLAEKERDAFLSRYGLPSKAQWQTTNGKKGLLLEMEKIKAQGFATQISDKQIMGIAVPVYQDQKPVASLSIYLPLFRYKESMLKGIVRQLQAASREIEKQLGG